MGALFSNAGFHSAYELSNPIMSQFNTPKLSDDCTDSTDEIFERYSVVVDVWLVAKYPIGIPQDKYDHAVVYVPPMAEPLVFKTIVEASKFEPPEHPLGKGTSLCMKLEYFVKRLEYKPLID